MCQVVWASFSGNLRPGLAARNQLSRMPTQWKVAEIPGIPLSIVSRVEVVNLFASGAANTGILNQIVVERCGACFLGTNYQKRGPLTQPAKGRGAWGYLRTDTRCRPGRLVFQSGHGSSSSPEAENCGVSLSLIELFSLANHVGDVKFAVLFVTKMLIYTNPPSKFPD